jgi:hypothetical protein
VTLWPRFVLLTAVSMMCPTASATMAISATIVISPEPGVLRRGDTAMLTYTITNIGDEIFTEAVAQTDYITSGPASTLFPTASAQSPPCLVGDFGEPFPPPLPSYFINFAYFRPLPILPGASRSCVIDIQISQDAAGPFDKLFGFSGHQGALATPFVTRSVHFGLGEDRAVPAFSPGSLALLVIGMLVAAALFAARLRRGQTAIEID